MNKKFISVAMATLLVSGAISGSVVRGSDPEEPILLPLFSAYTNSKLDYLSHCTVLEKYKKIEDNLFNRLKIQNLLIRVLEADYSNTLINSVVMGQKNSFILHTTVLEPKRGYLYMARKYLFLQMIQLCLNPYSKFYKKILTTVDIELLMKNFAQLLGPERSKGFAEMLKEDPNWLKNMIKLDFINRLKDIMFKTIYTV